MYHIEAFIPQKFRYNIERDARVRQVGGEGMPGNVEREAFPDSGFLGQHFQFPVYTTIRKARKNTLVHRLVPVLGKQDLGHFDINGISTNSFVLH